jgi:membrane protease YdiL (CAAX protease family)
LIPTFPPKMQKLWKVIGPVLLSALSIFISVLILQPIACLLDPTFSLLANRGVGKIGITVLVIWHILLLLTTKSKLALDDFFQTNVAFLKNKKWIKEFLKFFVIFAFFHAAFLAVLVATGYASIVSITLKFNLSFVFKIFLGFVATFFLAWTEELIFRGTVYKIFVDGLCPLASALSASFIFTLAHNLTNPLALITYDWKLGVGLFLLGLLLNLIFIVTGKLYAGMGAHAGLVIVKVLLRRMPFLVFLPPAELPFFMDKDLRQSILVHLFFIIANLILIYKFKDKLLKKSSL